MRYGVFSDVHANLEAFEAVLAFFNTSKIHQYIFLGDIVGYGADPKACIARLKALEAMSVAGNHDRAVIGLTNIDGFNDAAKKSIFWTKDHMEAPELFFLSGLKLVVEISAFCLVHGTLSNPGEFDYMTNSKKASETFLKLAEDLCFVGHSHVPGVFVEDEGKVYYENAQALSLEKNKRYIVNAGSVGQPRDGDPRACCGIFDVDAERIEFKRVDYDIAKAQKKIIEAGLPESLAGRLSRGL